MPSLRDIIFPVYGRNEITKFLMLGSMKFFIIFVLTLTRDTKDTLVVTQCGAEAIAFLKVYGVLPAATAYIAIFAKMSSMFSRQTLFYMTCIPFFLFFALYDIIIYPNIHTIQPSPSIVQSLIQSISFFIGRASDVVSNIIIHWPSALFFIVAEVYASVSVGVLFWKFANDVVLMSEAKRFYPMFAYMSSFAPMIAGQFVVRYAGRASNFGTSLRRMTMAISLCGIMICFLHYILDDMVSSQTTTTTETKTDAVKDNDNNKNNNKKKKKPKLSMMESITFLSSSQYLGLVTVLVLAYGLMYNFLEISWKSLVKRRYSNAMDYQLFMGNFSSLTGATTFVVIFLGSNIIKLLGWRIGALATPVVMSLIAIPFFICTVFLGVDTPTSSSSSSSVLNVAVMIGTVMILLSRAFKYGLFDPTTQMAYIPLDEESKVKGKAAIDVLGSRLGKSGASFIQQGLVFVFGNILQAAPAVFIIFYIVSVGWIVAASQLSHLYVIKAAEMEATIIDGSSSSNDDDDDGKSKKK